MSALSSLINPILVRPPSSFSIRKSLDTKNHGVVVRCPPIRCAMDASSSFGDTLGPIPGPSKGEDFTVQAKKVIEFSKLHPRTRRQFLRPELGDNVDFLFPDDLGMSTPRGGMTAGGKAPQVTSFAGRKRKAAAANTGAERAVRGNTGASGSSQTTSAVLSSSSPSFQTSACAHVSSPAGSTQAADSSQMVSSLMTRSGGHQVSTSTGSLPPRPQREGTAPWKPQFKDLQGKLLTEAHTGRDNTPVAALVENTSILPLDAEFFDRQSSAYLILHSAQNRYNANAAETTIGNRLLRYEDYINNICNSIGVTRQDSIMTRVNGMKKEVDRAKEANAKVAELQAALDKEKAINSVSRAELETLKADKEKAVKELETKELELAKERSLKEEALATVADWQPTYEQTNAKICDLFDCIAPHLEVCRSFRANVRPFWEKYEPADLENFDYETAGIISDATVESPIVDKVLINQSDDLVNVSAAEAHDASYHNPDEPAGED